jgi:succinoglycan biosynthesis transport protein ExoP
MDESTTRSTPTTTPVVSTPNNSAPPVRGFGSVGLPVESGHGIDFRRLWHIVQERLWLVVVCTVAGLALAIGYLVRTPKLYQGHTVLEVEIAESSPLSTDDSATRIRSLFLASQEALRTIEQNLTNRTLLARVIRAEGLADDGGAALFGRRNKSSAPATKSNTASADQTPAASGSEHEPAFTPTEDALAGALSGMVKPIIRRGTRLIDLYVINPDPAMASRLAEAVGREYIRSSIEHRASFSQETLRYLLEEEERLKENLQKSESAVAEYKAKTPDALQLGGGAGSTGSQAGSGSSGGGGGLVEDKLQELSTKLIAAKTERLRLEGDLKQVENAGDDLNSLLAVPSVANAPRVMEKRRELGQVESAMTTLAQRYKSKHPKMIAASAAYTEVKDALRRAALEQPSVLRNAIEQAHISETNLESAVHEQEKAALALNKAAIGYQQLARQAETDRALYESVLRQIKQTDVTKDAKAHAVSVIEHSQVSNIPVSPNSKKSIMLGLLGGLATGLAIVFGLNALDRSIRTVDQAEETLALPVLSAVPEVRREEKSNKEKDDRRPSGSATYRLMAEAPEGPAAEAFRNLRAALSLLGPESERKVFLFTSALPSEGKSFTSANYALSLAQQGHRVLLIDGDLRRPSLHKIFHKIHQPGNSHTDLEPDAPGIVDYLIGAVSLKEAVRGVAASEVDVLGQRNGPRPTLTATGGELYLLAGGLRAPNPAELLSGPQFTKLVEESSKYFNRVIIDTAPILAVSDTLLMTPHVQSVCIVVRAAKTAKNAVQRALTLLGAAGSRPAGVVLNRLPRSRGAGYYYYYASHGYGKGEGAYTGSGYSEERVARTRRS